MSKKPPIRHAWQLRPASSGLMNDRKCTVCGMTMGEAMRTNATVCFRANSIEHESNVVPLKFIPSSELSKLMESPPFDTGMLSAEKLNSVMADLKQSYSEPFTPSGLGASLFGLGGIGMQIIETPPPPPKIQVRKLTLSDGTCITPDKWLHEENYWWVQRFGYRDDPFAKHAYILNGSMAVMSHKHAVMLRDI